MPPANPQPFANHEDDHGNWKSLPYEAVGALVRALMVHCHKLGELQVAKQQALDEDPSQKKAITKRLVEKANGMMHVDKYLVFNPRTGQLATETWLGKHIQIVNGKPQFRHPSKQNKDPKILTLTIKITDGALALHLDLGNGASRMVRCWDLRSSKPQGDLKVLEGGFGHMADPCLEGDEEDFDEVEFPDENEFEDEIMDDSHGLQGHVSSHSSHVKI